jgi:adenosylcobinamide-phosphate synthase
VTASTRAIALLPIAVAIDALLGELPDAFHPVVWMGRSIALCERIAPVRGRLAPLIAGAAIAIAIPTLFAGAAWVVESGLRTNALVGIVVGAVMLKTTFALRALGRAAGVVRDALTGARIDDARRGLRALCSRDAAALDPPQLVAATVESVAENASDSFVAPLFWFALLGVPGAVFYRAVNTLDAMIGYRGRYEWLGKAAARLDDGMNLVPARLTAWLLIAGGALGGFDARRAARVLVRDGSQTESPNAGRPMAAMAGLLGVELTKAGHYRLGDSGGPLEPTQIRRAWRVTLIASALGLLVTGAMLEVRLALFD